MGHSLGGALAGLIGSTGAGVSWGDPEMYVMQRLLGVYTFAQPMIGDCQLGRYIEAHSNNPVPKSSGLSTASLQRSSPQDAL